MDKSIYNEQIHQLLSHKLNQWVSAPWNQRTTPVEKIFLTYKGFQQYSFPMSLHVELIIHLSKYL